MPPSNPLARLKRLLKGRGHATRSTSVARALLNVLRTGSGGDVIDPKRINRRQFAVVLLRAGTRLNGTDTEAAFRELARGSDVLDLEAAAQRAEAPRVDKKLRTAESIVELLKGRLLHSRHETTNLYKQFIKAAQPGSNQLTRPQMTEALKCIGLTVTPAAMMKLFQNLDKRSSGTIDFRDFLVQEIGVPTKNLFDVNGSRGTSRSGTPRLGAGNSRPQTSRGSTGGKWRNVPQRSPTPLTQSVAEIVDTLRERLSNSTHTVGTTRASLLDCFREFLSRAGCPNSRTVDQQHFQALVKRFGISASVEAIEAAFASLDSRSTGEIDFRDFQLGLFPREVTTPSQSVDHYVTRGARLAQRKAKFIEAQSVIDTEEELLEALHRKLYSATEGIAASFKRFLSKARSTNTVSYESFVFALRAFGLNCTDKASKRLFRSVDINRDGVIDFQEFVQQVLQVARTQTDALSLARRTDISHAKGMAKIEKLKAVQLREMQEQQSARQIGPVAETINVAEVLRESLLSHVHGGGANFVRVYKVFKSISGVKNSHRIDFDNFQRALLACGCPLNSQKQKDDAAAVFSAMDTNGDGTIDYQELMQHLFGIDKTGLQEAVDWNVRNAKIREKAIVQFVNQAGTMSSPATLFKALRDRINPDENGVRRAFQHFRKMSSEASKGGHITLDGFRGALRSFQLSATDLCSESLFFDIDADASGSVDFNEFCTAIAHSKIHIHEAEVGRLYKPGLVHPSDQARYSRILKYYPLLSKAPVVEKKEQEVERLQQESTEDLDFRRVKIKTDLRQTLEKRLARAHKADKSIAQKLLDAKREFGMLPDVAQSNSAANSRPSTGYTSRPKTADAALLQRRRAQRQIQARSKNRQKKPSPQRRVRGSSAGYMKRNVRVGRRQPENPLDRLAAVGTSSPSRTNAW